VSYLTSKRLENYGRRADDLAKAIAERLQQLDPDWFWNKYLEETVRAVVGQWRIGHRWDEEEAGAG
jgi:hypothetical protein